MFSAFIVLVLASTSFHAKSDDYSYYSEDNLYAIVSDDTCTACYEIEGYSRGMGSPWLTESGLAMKVHSEAKKGPVNVLHPGLDLKQVLKKEPKEAPVKPVPAEPAPGSPSTPISIKGGFNSTEVAEKRKILIVKKKPVKPEPAGKSAPNINVTLSSYDLEYFLVKPAPGGRDIFATPHPKPVVVGKKIPGPSPSAPIKIDAKEKKHLPPVKCKKIGPGADCEEAGGVNATATEYDSTYDYMASSVGLYGTDNTWWRSDGLGTFFELSDVYNENIYYSGTLCPESDSGDACGMALGEGFYVFHVYGAEDPNKDSIAWNFCGTHGGAETDLLVYISSDGDCSPMSMATSAESVPDTRSYMVLNGQIELTGYFSDSFNWEDKKVLMSSLLYQSRELMTMSSFQSFQEWLRSVVVYNVKETGRDGDVVTNEVSFFMAVVAEDFGVYDVDQGKKLFLLDVMSAALQTSIESYDFLYNIFNVDQFSSKSITDNLAGVYDAKFISMSILSSQDAVLSKAEKYGGLFTHVSDSIEVEASHFSAILSRSISLPAVAGVAVVALMLVGVAWLYTNKSQKTHYAKVEQDSVHSQALI